MATYLFHVTLAGEGATPEEAWLDAVQSLGEEPGECPGEDERDIQSDEENNAGNELTDEEKEELRRMFNDRKA